MRKTFNNFAGIIKRASARSVVRMHRLFMKAVEWKRSFFIRHVREFSISFACSSSLVLTVLILVFAPTMREWLLVIGSENNTAAGGESVRSRDAERLLGRIRNLKLQFDSFTPRKPYLIVDTSGNRFRLMNGTTILREGTCSTGSYVNLKAGDDRQWVFRTPRGRFHVQLKEKSPMWYKPDWAFIEEGLPVPPPLSPERYERGVLGEYALHIGDDYLIHGTLYKRLLGMPVTHGCVRLGDEDLRIVYRNLNLGSAVYIY